MKLSEFLECGLSKAELGERLGVSKQAVGKWEDIPSKWQKMVDVILEEEEVKAEVVESALSQREPDDFSFEEIQYLCHLRPTMSDYDISQANGLRVYEFTKLVKKLGVAILDGDYVRRDKAEILAEFGT